MAEKSSSFMGFETWYNSARMAAKMQFYIITGLTLLVAFICYQIYQTTLTDAQVSARRTMQKNNFAADCINCQQRDIAAAKIVEV